MNEFLNTEERKDLEYVIKQHGKEIKDGMTLDEFLDNKHPWYQSKAARKAYERAAERAEKERAQDEAFVKGFKSYYERF